ncbi:MAG: uridine kinase [Roseburia sp.]|nr:uridine kinase [Roseburia sp.]
MENRVSEPVRIIRSLPETGRPRIIAIDGRCASGKTTLAEQLREVLDCTVIHMDEFFLRPEQRTQERLRTAGGNVDYERFLTEVLSPLREGTVFAYRPYDCKRQALAEPIRIVPGELALVEGSYSCHPALWDAYDLRIFLTVEPQEQLRRIRKRNGEQAAEIFLKKWIPMEELYFSAFQIESRCDLHYKIAQA